MVARSRLPATSKQVERLREMKLPPQPSDAQSGMMIRYLNASGKYYPEKVNLRRLRQLKKLYQKRVVICQQDHPYSGQIGQVIGFRLRTNSEIAKIQQVTNNQYVGQLQVEVQLDGNPSIFLRVAPSAIQIKPQEHQRFLPFQ